MKKKQVSLKEVMKKLDNQQSMMNIIKESKPHAFVEWGTRNISNSGVKLQFSIQDKEMIVTYNAASNDYFMTFFKIVNNRRKVINNKKNIERENLYKCIDNILRNKED